MLQCLNVLFKERGPELNALQPQQCQVQRDDQFPSAAGHAAALDTGQDAIGLLSHLGPLLVMFSQLSTSTPKSLSAEELFTPPPAWS